MPTRMRKTLVAGVLLFAVMLPCLPVSAEPTAPTAPVARPIMIDLGTLGGSYSFAWGVNASGQVVGYSSTASVYSHALLWDLWDNSEHYLPLIRH